MWQYFTHSTTGWTLFTALVAGFVNFSNRISSLLCVTLALTSSSRTDKQTPWMLSWRSGSLTDRNERGTRFLVPSPSTFALTNAEMASENRRTHTTSEGSVCFRGCFCKGPRDPYRSEGRYASIDSPLSKAWPRRGQTRITCPLRTMPCFLESAVGSSPTVLSAGQWEKPFGED